MAALRDQTTSARTVAHRLGVTTTTLYMYVNRDGSLKQAGQAVEINDVFALYTNGPKLLYEQTVSSGGHAESRKAEFPFHEV